MYYLYIGLALLFSPIIYHIDVGFSICIFVQSSHKTLVQIVDFMKNAKKLSTNLLTVKIHLCYTDTVGRSMTACFFWEDSMKLLNPFKKLNKFEWILWGASVITIIASAFLSGKGSVLETISSLVGVTALIFVAKGLIIGQALTVVFSVLYGLVSLQFHYWGEMITYLFMSAPIALLATIEWLRHQYKDTDVVEVSKVTGKQVLTMCIIGTLTTVAFYFVLRVFDTPNLFFSTLSITTSFMAAYLTFLRSPYYGIGYGLNDVVLIILWTLASIKDISYLPMVMCFVMFLLNDMYGFFNWKRIRTRQNG